MSCILIIDDIEDNRLVIKNILKKEGFNFLEADNGEDGIKLAISQKIDLIILDIGMPKVDGFEVLNKLKELKLLNKIPILMLTGFDVNEFKLKALELGAIDFISKPFDKTELLVRVKSLINLYQAIFEKEKKLEDLVEKKSLEISKQYFTDSLTSLPNRMRLIEDMKHLKEKTLFIIDIDSFKEINNFYGIERGDELLIKFAKRLSEFALTNSFLCYKIPSDQFTILIDKTIHKQRIIEVTNNLKEIFYLPFLLNKNCEINLNITIGIANDGENIYSQADMALKSAKQQRIDFLIYDKELNIQKKYENNLIWTKKLKDALLESKIICYYQPVINNATGEIEKYETLVRLIDDENKVISPYFFLDIAKKTRLYFDITKLVIYKSFFKFKDSKFGFSINLSFLDIINKDIVNFIFSMLEDFPNKEQITFEILESEGIDNYEEVIDFIEKVKFLGCKIAIDDFGTGYSNFVYLMKLKVDFIKIDGSMIKNIDTDENSQIIVSTIVDFAKKLKIKTVGEFVHSKSVYDKLKELGVNYSQGFYLGEPRGDIL